MERTVQVRSHIFLLLRVIISLFAGTVVASGEENDSLVNTRVFLTPSRGWKEDPIAPENRYELHLQLLSRRQILKRQ